MPVKKMFAMKRVRVAAGSLMIVTLVALVLCGCGKKGEPKLSLAEKTIKDSTQKMVDINSLKTTAAGKVLRPKSEIKEESFTYEVITARNGGVTDVQMSGKSDGREMKAYLQGGWLYEYDSNRGWTKQRVDDASGANIAQFISPETVMKMTEYAKDTKFLPEENGNYVVSFDVTSRFFEKMISDLESRVPPSSSGQAKTTIELLKSYLKEMKFSMVLKIEKSSMLWKEARVKASIDIGGVFGNVSTETTALFSDYNQPFTVTVPPDAQNANEVQPAGIELPPIPGISF